MPSPVLQVTLLRWPELGHTACAAQRLTGPHKPACTSGTPLQCQLPAQQQRQQDKLAAFAGIPPSLAACLHLHQLQQCGETQHLRYQSVWQELSTQGPACAIRSCLPVLACVHACLGADPVPASCTLL